MYHNPVKIIKTKNWREECGKFKGKLGIHNPLIITSNGNLKRQKLSIEFNSNSILSNVKPHPTFESCQMAINFSKLSEFDGVIAIGGGSVMDTAKVVMAYMGTGKSDIHQLLKVTTPCKVRVPSIFIPTTHGSGSEVTMWGTVWNMNEKKKYSISNPELYPDIAILDGSITLSLPLDISLITTLDSLCHSFEAIWNKNSNSTSTSYAIEAICLILTHVEQLKESPHNIDLRNVLLEASNISGLSFSNTKTAAAHSISYPLTINYGIPHGLACYLPLLPLLQINRGSIENELDLITKNLEMTYFSELIDSIKRIPDGIFQTNLKSWGVARTDLDDLAGQSFTKDRMDNNIQFLSKSDIKIILTKMYE